MATESKQKLQYTYRATIAINDVDMGALAFLGLTEIFDFMGNLYPMKILMVNMSILDLRSKYFLDMVNREAKVVLSLYRVETSMLPSSDPNYVKTEYTVYTNKEFVGTFDEEFIPLSNDEITRMNENDADTKDEMMQMVRIHLKEYVLNPFVEDVFNMVTDTNTTIPDVVSAAFMKCAHPNLKLSMMPPSNTNNIPANTLIEPMGFVQLLEYFQNYYGMYAYNYNTFIKDYTCYIISREGIRNKNESDYIIRAVPATSANNITQGFVETNKDNIVIVDATQVHVSDIHNEYYSNNRSYVDEDGTIHHPKNTKKNISLLVEDYVVQTTYNNENASNKLMDISVVCPNTYLDINPDMMFQVESNDVIFSKLAVWGYHRVVSPQGCVMNMNLFTRA